MSVEQATNFLNEVAEDEELNELAGQKMQADDVIELASERGYDFTVDELIEAQKEFGYEGELSDEELEGAAGGTVVIACYVACNAK